MSEYLEGRKKGQTKNNDRQTLRDATGLGQLLLDRGQTVLDALQLLLGAGLAGGRRTDLLLALLGSHLRESLQILGHHEWIGLVFFFFFSLSL